MSISIIYIVAGDSRRESGAGLFSGQSFPTGAVFREGGFSGLEHAVWFLNFHIANYLSYYMICNDVM